MQVTPETAPATTAASRPAVRSAALASDFQTFLRMLTVQMQNQDPLNPMEATDFAVQLATFAGVEQQARTNQLLEAMNPSGDPNAVGRLAQWVGMEVRWQGPVQIDGGLLSLAIDPPAAADRLTLTVRDAHGRLVSREPVPLGTTEFQWAGTDAEGAPLPAGAYLLSLEAAQGDTVLSETPVQIYSTVREAAFGRDGTVELRLEDGNRILADAVGALRRPAG